MPLLIAVTAWLVAINLIAYALFGIDKAAAIEGDRRIPERTLLLVSLIGGSPGAWVAQELFRHKTRKQPFRGWFFAIAGLQILVLIALVIHMAGFDKSLF